MKRSKIEDPIRHLRDEHDRVLAVVEAIEHAVVELQHGQTPTALSALRDGLAFLQREVRAHAALEESVLYPALGLHLPPLTIEALTEEHSDIWWAMDLLEEGLREECEIRVAELRWHATALVDLLRRHIDKENNVLGTMVSRPLSPAESASLANAMSEFLHARRRTA